MVKTRNNSSSSLADSPKKKSSSFTKVISKKEKRTSLAQQVIIKNASMIELSTPKKLPSKKQAGHKSLTSSPSPTKVHPSKKKSPTKSPKQSPSKEKSGKKGFTKRESSLSPKKEKPLEKASKKSPSPKKLKPTPRITRAKIKPSKKETRSPSSSPSRGASKKKEPKSTKVPKVATKPSLKAREKISAKKSSLSKSASKALETKDAKLDDKLSKARVIISKTSGPSKSSPDLHKSSLGSPIIKDFTNESHDGSIIISEKKGRGTKKLHSGLLSITKTSTPKSPSKERGKLLDSKSMLKSKSKTTRISKTVSFSETSTMNTSGLPEETSEHLLKVRKLEDQLASKKLLKPFIQLDTPSSSIYKDSDEDMEISIVDKDEYTFDSDGLKEEISSKPDISALEEASSLDIDSENDKSFVKCTIL